MLSAHRTSHLIGTIYEVTAGSEDWSVLAREVAHCFDAPLAGVGVRNAGGEFQVRATVGVDPDLAAAYSTYYWTKDLIYQRVAASPRGVPHAVHHLDSDPQIAASEFFTDYLRPLGCCHGMQCLTPADRGVFVGIGVGRTAGQPPFSPDDLSIMSILAPHLERANRIRNDLRMTRAAAELSGTVALDLLPNGVFLLDDAGRIVFVNSLGNEILGEHDGLVLRSGRVHALNAIHDANLAKLIAAALRAAEPRVIGRVRVVRISSGEPLAVVVAAVRGYWRLEGFTPAVAIFVSDPERTSYPVIEQLRALYGLTRKEAEVAEAVMKGHRLVDVARTLGVGRETARSHLKNVYQKTSTHSQVELAHLLLRGATPGAAAPIPAELPS